MKAAVFCSSRLGSNKLAATDQSYAPASSGYLVSVPLSACSPIHVSARSRVEKTPEGNVPPAPLKIHTNSMSIPVSGARLPPPRSGPNPTVQLHHLPVRQVHPNPPPVPRLEVTLHRHRPLPPA